MKYPILFALLATELGLLLALALSAGNHDARREVERAETRTLVAALGLTDLALWTEARYTRHPSQADLFSAFQDFPGAIEHFPAGSVIGPPPALMSPWVAASPRSMHAEPQP